MRSQFLRPGIFQSLFGPILPISLQNLIFIIGKCSLGIIFIFKNFLNKYSGISGIKQLHFNGIFRINQVFLEFRWNRRNCRKNLMFRCLTVVCLHQKSVQAVIQSWIRCKKQISKGDENAVVSTDGKLYCLPQRILILPKNFRRPSDTKCSKPREWFAGTYRVFHSKIFEYVSFHICHITGTGMPIA